MRVRLIGGSLIALLVVALVVAAGPGSSVGAQDAATPPAAASPEPAGQAAPPMVTIVTWYAPSADGETLVLSQLQTNNSHVASQVTNNGRALKGDVDFEDPGNDGLPRITLGDSAFNAYPVSPDDPDTVFRWLYFDDDPSLRPATLVLQIQGVKGAYDGFNGTATFVSRGADVGGVLVIVLNPPEQ